MYEELRERLRIPSSRLDAINATLLRPDLEIVNEFLEIVSKHGTPEEINGKARQAGSLPILLKRVAETTPEYLGDLEWLRSRIENGDFVSVGEYRRKILGDRAATGEFTDDYAVTLEVSACQYFPWVIGAARRAIEQGSLMPGRFIRVRKMKEQEWREALLVCGSYLFPRK